jgi:hypothetical protein
LHERAYPAQLAADKAKAAVFVVVRVRELLARERELARQIHRPRGFVPIAAEHCPPGPETAVFGG